MNEVINFETKPFSEDQNGINLATEELNSVLGKIADKSCKKVRKRNKKENCLDKSGPIYMKKRNLKIF